MTTAKHRKAWSPPPLEVGDRVKHLAKDTFGFIVKLNGTTATVSVGGEECVVEVWGLSYRPHRAKILQEAKLIRRSRKDKSLRAALGLPRFVGVNDKSLTSKGERNEQ